MKKYLFLFLLLIGVMKLSAQVSFVIKELNVKYIVANLHDEIDIEDETEGPYVVLKCSLTNLDNKDVSFTPSESNVEFLFNYRGRDYSVDVHDLSFFVRENEVINTNEKIEFDLGRRLLLGTPLRDQYREDYSMILLEVLPTLRVHYKDKNLNIYSSRIESVRIL